MMQRMCNGCQKLIRHGDNYIHVEHDNEVAQIRDMFDDVSEKDFHDWACVGIAVVADAEARAARTAKYLDMNEEVRKRKDDVHDPARARS